MGELDGGIAAGDFIDGLTPEDAIFEDVGLVDRRELFAAAQGGLEGDMGDALDLAPAVDRR
jgi:hypothetical protein